jgi:predicted MFS family arabinose efflux permease
MVAFRMQDVILGWQMLELTDSAFWVGLSAFAYGIPLLIWSPVTGIMADLLERRRVIAMALALGGLSSVALGALSALGWVRPWLVVLISFLLGSAFTIYAPARHALLPTLIPADRLMSASAVEYASSQLMGFLGPVIAGTLLDVADIWLSLLVQMAFFLLSIVLFFRIRATGRQEVPASRPARGLGHLRPALAYLREDRVLKMVALLGLVMVPVGMAHQKVMPVFVRDVLGAGASSLGLMLGISSLGVALAGLVMAAFGEGWPRARVLLLSSGLLGCALLALALTRRVAPAVPLLFVVGVLLGTYLSLSNVLFQSRPPDALRGRVIVAWAIVWGVLPFASLAAGSAAERWGVAAVIGGSGAICALFAGGTALLRFGRGEGG